MLHALIMCPQKTPNFSCNWTATDADKVINPQHFRSDPADVRIRIRIRLVEVKTPWRRFALSEHSLVFVKWLGENVCSKMGHRLQSHRSRANGSHGSRVKRSQGSRVNGSRGSWVNESYGSQVSMGHMCHGSIGHVGHGSVSHMGYSSTDRMGHVCQWVTCVTDQWVT